MIIDGNKNDGSLRHPGMRRYIKIPVVVKATKQQQAFEVTVSWQDQPLQAKAGDWLVEDGKSSWPVADDIFAKTYQPSGDGFVKTGFVYAVAMQQDFTVQTLEGTAHGKAGDYLVQGPAGEAWPIVKQTFLNSYTEQ